MKFKMTNAVIAADTSLALTLQVEVESSETPTPTRAVAFQFVMTGQFAMLGGGILVHVLLILHITEYFNRSMQLVCQFAGPLECPSMTGVTGRDKRRVYPEASGEQGGGLVAAMCPSV